MNKIYWFIAVIITCSYLNSGAQADELVVREFEKHQLSSVYWSEGASYGDFNQDGHMDVVSGPHIWLGPDYNIRTNIIRPSHRRKWDLMPADTIRTMLFHSYMTLTKTDGPTF